MRRKPAIIIAVAVTLLLGVVVSLPWIVDVNRYRGRLEAAARQRLHRDVTLGPMRLSVIPLGLRVERASVGEDPAFQTGRPFARGTGPVREPEAAAAAPGLVRASRGGAAGSRDRARSR